MSKMKKVLLISFIFATMISAPAFAHSIKIAGPSQITVKVGQPVSLKYTIYVDGHNMTNASYSEISPMQDPQVVSLSKNLEVYRNAEGDLYGDTPSSEPYFVAGLKPGKGYFSLSTSAYFYDGSTVITTKKVVVTIKKGTSLCLNGELYDYNTRSNKFIVKLRNYSSKSVKIISSGAKAINYSYKSFDRSLRISGKKSVTIKPGKTKKVVFKASGRSTWYDCEDFYIKCKCKLGKKTYNIRIYAGDSTNSVNGYIPGYVAAKRKGKWKNLMLCSAEFVRDYCVY